MTVGLRCLLAASMLMLTAAVSRQPQPKPYVFPELPFFPERPQDPANPVTQEGVLLGRHLFYDPILSADVKTACGSCHRQEAAFSDGPKRFSAGAGGVAMRRNTPALFNLAWYPRLFWDGRAGSIEAQVAMVLHAREELNLNWPEAIRRLSRSTKYRQLFKDAFGNRPIDSNMVMQAIGQFERTLLSYRSKYDRVIAGSEKFTQAELDGFDIMNDMSKGDCLHCHSSDADALGVLPGFSNNGLDAGRYSDPGYATVSGRAADSGSFKIPSLRNIALTAPYMHDGRFANLDEVLRFYSEGVHAGGRTDTRMSYAHRGGVRLSAGERANVIAFLRTLTDSAFVKDPAFGNPFGR